jgi:hypothetical protein
VRSSEPTRLCATQLDKHQFVRRPCPVTRSLRLHQKWHQVRGVAQPAFSFSMSEKISVIPTGQSAAAQNPLRAISRSSEAPSPPHQWRFQPRSRCQPGSRPPSTARRYFMPQPLQQHPAMFQRPGVPNTGRVGHFVLFQARKWPTFPDSGKVGRLGWCGEGGI